VSRGTFCLIFYKFVDVSQRVLYLYVGVGTRPLLRKVPNNNPYNCWSQSSLTRQSCSLLVGINGWVSEFTVVVFGVEVLLDGVGDLEEVGHVD